VGKRGKGDDSAGAGGKGRKKDASFFSIKLALGKKKGGWLTGGRGGKGEKDPS